MSDAQSPVNRTLLIVLGVVVALAALFFFVIEPLLLGEDEADLDEPFVPPQAIEPEAPPVEPAEEPVPETFEVFTARDPFQQLVRTATGGDAPADGGAGTGGTGGAGTGGTGTGGTGTGGTGTGGTGTGGAGTGGTGGAGTDGAATSRAEVGATRVSLVDVFTDDDGRERVQVVVNGRGHEAGEGEVFAERFRVLDIAGRCATFLFGDNRFTLCKGEEIRK